jgi:hypothetical protein
MLQQGFRISVLAVALVLLLTAASPGMAASGAPSVRSVMAEAAHGGWSGLVAAVEHTLADLLGIGGPAARPGSARHAPMPQAVTQSGGGGGSTTNGAGAIDPNGNQ